MPLTIFSLNCRGLNKSLKRKLIFTTCKKYDISCLQETYITENNCKQWSNEWNGSLHYCKGTSNSNGLIVLINKNLDIQGTPQIIISEQRILGIEIKTSNKKCFIINIYAPNKKSEKIKFYEKLYTCMNSVSEKMYDTVIISGDFNSVLDNSLDIISGAPHDTTEINLFKTFVNNFDLCDTWRLFNPKTKDFSWHRQNPFVARRLDYILCSNSTHPNVSKVEHKYIPCSDHKAVVLQFKTENFKRGPGIWKFNNSLLNDQLFLADINCLIDTFLLENAHKEPSLTWELLKNEIKAKTIQICNEKRQKTFCESKQLLNEINKINERLSTTPDSKELHDNLIRLQKKLEILSLHKTKGAQIRSRIKFIEDGEKNTKYFLSIEKSRGDKNTIQELKRDNKNLINPQNILKEVKQYYTNLYTKDIDVDDTFEAMNGFLDDVQCPKLSTDEALSCESEIEIKDISYALSQLNNDSAPGSDGITVPFYKVFWKKLQNPLLHSFKSSLDKGELSVSQKRGIITLIHKGKDLDRNDLGNWRPITLLNTDYKIFSKVIAQRIQPVIDSLINTNQKGFIKGRNISDLIRMIDDSLLITRKYKTPGLIVSVDFRKAFDSVSKMSIINALNIFNFGPIFSKLISVLVNNNESCIRNGGWYSSFFPCEKGIRQGCCASPYLFLLVAELLSLKLRNTEQISGISIPGKDIVLNKIHQYADDTSLILKDERELESAFKIIESFGTLSGLRLNRQKSVVLPIGGYANDDADTIHVTWLKPYEYIKILGIYFSAETEASNIDLNWKSKIQNMSRIIHSWRTRNVSLYGKIILCKTFILSKINYILQSLSLPESALAEIDTLMFKFIWQKQLSNKKAFEKIKRTTLCLDVASGGLKMISVKDQQKVFHVNWIKKLNTYKENINIINDLTEKAGGIEYIMKCKLSNPQLSLDTLIDSEFWKQVACTWTNLTYAIGDQISTPEEILQQPIFLNSAITYHGRPLHFPFWIKNKIIFMHDLFPNGTFIDFKTLSNKFKRYPGLIFDYNALYNSIPDNWKSKLNNTNNILSQNLPSTDYTILKLNNYELRNLIISLKTNSKCNEQFWERKLGFEVSKHYDIAYKATKESRLRLLHFKIMHNIYPTNILLYKMKVRPNILCNVCKVTDFIEHFFVECQQIEGFWNFVSSYIKYMINIQVKLNTKDILLGLTYSDHNNIKREDIDYINYIILLGKHCISKLKYGNINSIYLVFELELSLRTKVSEHNINTYS